MQEFLGSQNMVVKFGPFVDTTNGDESTGEVDVLTVTLVKPNGTVVDGDDLTTPAVKEQRSSTDIWSLTINATDFMSGDWELIVESDWPNSKPYRQILRWGQGTRQDASTLTADDTFPPGDNVNPFQPGGIATRVYKLHALRMNRKRIERGEANGGTEGSGPTLITYAADGTSVFAQEFLLDRTGTNAVPSVGETVGTTALTEVHETSAAVFAD